MRTMYDTVEECRTRLQTGLGLSCDALASGGCSGRGQECESSDAERADAKIPPLLSSIFILNTR